MKAEGSPVIVQMLGRRWSIRPGAGKSNSLLRKGSPLNSAEQAAAVLKAAART